MSQNIFQEPVQWDRTNDLALQLGPADQPTPKAKCKKEKKITACARASRVELKALGASCITALSADAVSRPYVQMLYHGLM
jgi:hypothetical protein